MENLRELRNKILGEPKLEFGCEVLCKNEKWLVIHTDIKEYWEIVVLNNLKDRNLNVTVENIKIRSIKILGKPVNWGEINLLLDKLPTKNNIPYWYGISSDGKILAIDEYHSKHSSGSVSYISDTELDFTKSPEQQKPEVIEKIISLIE